MLNYNQEVDYTTPINIVIIIIYKYIYKFIFTYNYIKILNTRRPSYNVTKRIRSEKAYPSITTLTIRPTLDSIKSRQKWKPNLSK